MSDQRFRLIDRLLTFLDRPWKAVALLVFLVVMGFGYFLWLERVRIADMVFHSASRPQLRIDAFTDDVRHLLASTKADAAVLASINMEGNSGQDVAGFTRDGARWIPVTGEQALFYPGNSMQDIVRLLRNEVVCRDVPATAPPGPEWDAQAAAGMTRACLVAVPPIISITVGLLIVSWKQALRPESEAQAVGIIQRSALRYANW
jgi:hypothetical protein